MTANPFAALLRDVPRYDGYGTFDPDGDVVRLSEVLAALARAMGPDDLVEQAGMVLERLRASSKGLREFYKPGAVELIPSYTMDDAAALITALLARIAGQEAQIKGLEAEAAATDDLMAADSCRIAALETALAAEKAKTAKLVEALNTIDALDPEVRIGDCSVNAISGLVLRMGEIARAAITEAGQ